MAQKSPDSSRKPLPKVGMGTSRFSTPAERQAQQANTKVSSVQANEAKMRQKKASAAEAARNKSPKTATEKARAADRAKKYRNKAS